jgi:hypothetical protein
VPRPIVFVCSSGTHVRMFAPVARVLEAAGRICRFASLDDFYQQGVNQAGLSLGIEPVLLPGPGMTLKGERFYERGTVAVWRDIIGTRKLLAQALDELTASTLVFGNDSGLVEKSLIDVARQRSIPTVLVQDGRLAWQRPAPTTLRGGALSGWKRLLSPILDRAGYSYLAASRYGEGRTTLALASGAAGARILQARAVGETRVVITGQPRYDGLIALVEDRSEPRNQIVMFTSPFVQTGLGAARQSAQEKFAQETGRALRAVGIAFLVKPHPLENADRYRSLLGVDGVTTEDPAGVMKASSVALIGISTLVEKAAILHRPVLVPGRVLHDRSFEPSLPDEHAYPRVENAADIFVWLGRLTEPEARAELLERQSAAMREEILFSSSEPAAVRVAAAIAEAGMA